MRRNIRLLSLEDVEAELNYLDGAGSIQTSGLWTYYQILSHMNDAVHFSMTGFPSVLPGFIRKTVGRYMFKKLIKTGIMKPGYLNPSAPKKREEGDARLMLQKLRSTLNDFKNYNGEMSVHPIFDRLSKEDYTKLHSIHFSLHLSFAHPDFSIPKRDTTLPPTKINDVPELKEEIIEDKKKKKKADSPKDSRSKSQKPKEKEKPDSKSKKKKSVQKKRK
ncbi:MAG TPA: DUF1569 domain-containing protein [Leptospiraceae bacterium]|nr:DUF1569 domain-containing protein [Leptospiraceae bacterium]HMY66195.1 DUF1569 domain-containing protein [Leptospiraceae bacterium]HMZ58959.1 DUF1569 domain-containing protein [Leptospiraceae bacterium]HNF13504.1 DUF1569 domain-containing protein [Leptospiraceae bacterium]HNF26522.1 DUF1569 domain-containing protein [Leptospiraceae bacterium]